MGLKVSTICLFLVIELAACGQFPLDRIEPNYRIFVDMTGREHTSLDADTGKEKLARGVGQGAATGGSTGVAVAVLCGPWFLLCLPITAGAGTVIGGGIGATAGFAGLPEETAKSLNDVLVEIDDRRDFRQELVEEVVILIPDNDQASQENAEVLATVGIKRVAVRQHRNNNISFRMSASLRVEQGGRNERLYQRLKKIDYPQHYDCSSPKRNAEDWLEDEQDTIDKALTSCIQTVSESISADLMKVADYYSNY
jgi:hypothetical protein